MKAACIVLADVFCDFAGRVSYPLGLQFATDEESAGENGTLYQIKQGVRTDLAICGECGRSTGTYEIANKAKGIIVAEISFKGQPAHAAYPWRGDNAATQACRFIHEIHERYPIPTMPTSETTVTVTGIVASSDAHTKTPDQAIVKLDIRFTPGDPHFSDKEKLAAFIRQLSPQATIQELHAFSAPIYADPNSRLLQNLKAAAENVEGKSFQFVQRNATSDGRYYGDVNNEACEFGIAGEHQHGNEEYITIQDFKYYRRTLQAFLASEQIEKHSATIKRPRLIDVDAKVSI
jgi:succinyl-diaminopimelate desuccinylase